MKVVLIAVATLAVGGIVIYLLTMPQYGRARMMANESSAAVSVRQLAAQQVTYSASFPGAGYAPDLASMGPGPTGTCSGEPDAHHACLIDNLIGNDSCKPGIWCTKYNYKFTIVAYSNGGVSGKTALVPCISNCAEYVISATPVDSSLGTRNFCSMSDGEVRAERINSPRLNPYTPIECSALPVI